MAEATIKFKLGEYFRPGSHKVAISVPELVQQTNAFSVKNRPGCVPKLTGSNPRDLFLDYNVKCDLKTSDPAGHEVKVHFDLSSVTDETSAKNLDVEVSCSCPAALWWGGQFNLHQRDALYGTPRPLLTAPTERLDLRGKFILCKHEKAVFERILPSVQHNIVNIIRKRNVEETKKRKRDLGEDLTPKKLVQRKKKEPVPEAPAAPAPNPPTHVVKRDTPATEEEREKTPVLDEKKIEAPSTAPEEPKPEPTAPVPTLEDLSEEPAPVSATPPNKELPAPAEPPSLKPQKTLPRLNPRDNERLKQLQKQDQLRQQRETQRRLRNNPGYRR